jgi:hypothetical protein
VDVTLWLGGENKYIYRYICTVFGTDNLYSSPNIIRVMKSRRMSWAVHVASVVDRGGAYSVLVGKPEGKRQLGRPRHRWEDNIKIDLQELGKGAWIGFI